MSKQSPQNPNPNLFYPILCGERVEILVDDDDEKKFTDGPGYKGIIRDVNTGLQYKLFGRACSSTGCFCDATIIPIK